jgi:hypothetical protein
MRSAQTILDELVSQVQPPAGCAIVFTELPGGPNWIAASGILEEPALHRYNAKIIELREAEPMVDWSGMKILAGERRRVVHRIFLADGKG